MHNSSSIKLLTNKRLGSRCTYWKGNVTLKRNQRPLGTSKERRKEERIIIIKVQSSWTNDSQGATTLRSLQGIH